MSKNHSYVFVLSMCWVILSFANVSALNNGLSRTPPMGFNAWNWFGCQNSKGNGRVNDALIKGIADAFVSSGMKAAGYEFVNLDDCWAESGRDSKGGLVPIPGDFPNGIRSLANYVHSKGLKLGIYTEIGYLTCAQKMPGLRDHESQDIDSFVSWGIDYVKVDFCSGSNAVSSYVKIRNTLVQSVARMTPTVPTAHPILYSICNWGNSNPWEWGDTTGNLWRTTLDINGKWNTMLRNLDGNAPHYGDARIGGWNDPDMLEVGIGDFQTDLAKNRAHFSLWCMMAAPLLAGNDVRSMSANTKSILTNADAIAVDQDTLGGDTTKGIIQGRRIVSGASEIWVKLLKGKTKSEYAVLFFNRSNSGPVSMSVSTAQIASLGGDIASGKKYTVRDLWANKNLADWTAGGSYTTPTTVAVNDVFMMRLGQIPTSILPPLATIKVSEMRVVPHSDRVDIQMSRSGPFAVSLITMNGAVVYTKQVGGTSCRIPTTGLSKGLYLVNVQTAKEQFSQKIILK